jgi:hypothetical protein
MGNQNPADPSQELGVGKPGARVFRHIYAIDRVAVDRRVSAGASLGARGCGGDRRLYLQPLTRLFGY